jgi:imidazolonepropionase-like amidohydrolase
MTAGSRKHKRITPATLCMLALSFACDSPVDEPALAITGAALIDGSGAAPIMNAVVVVRDGLVVCAGHESECPLGEGTSTLDATGRWLAPGLIDSHIHWQIWYDSDGKLSLETAARAARVYLANGITTVVDVGGQRWVKPEHREVLGELARSGAPVPRMLFSGWIDRTEVDETQSKDARLLARDLLASGVDGIKLRDGLLPSEYEVIVAEADRVGRPVFGHTYFMGDREFIDQTAEATVAGVDGVFHVLGIPPVAPGRQPPLPMTPMDDWQSWWLAGAALWSHTTEQSMDELIRLMIDHGTWLQPTLVTEQALIEPDHFRDHPSWSHSPMTRDELNAGFPVYKGEELEQYRAAYRQMQKFVLRFHEAGGMLVAGTDGMPVPGFGLQEEMGLLVEAGVPPMVVLESATRNAAAAWHWLDRIGTLEAGKAADLIILGGNPLEEMGNSKEILRVMKDGILYDPASLLAGTHPVQDNL